jgi:hypothetical protein
MERRMMTLVSIPRRIALLIPRLGSDNEGERLATVGAIQRTLRAAGCDFHDLARALGGQAPPKKEAFTWGGLAAWCRDQDDGRLNERERKFVTDLAARLVLGGEPTSKQADWLRSIYAKFATDGRD